METVELNDKGLGFEATLLRATKPICTVLFAAGSGGHPIRHKQLLVSLLQNQCTVIAPHFDRILTPMPRGEELILRARKLKAALDYVFEPNVPAVGLGHSIGATLLLSLAGGKIWLSRTECLPIPYDNRLQKLVLFAPPTGFFQAPSALHEVQIPLQIWTGASDKITPPKQAQFLQSQLAKKVPLDFKVVEGAGHFSFMNSLPPHVIDTMSNREEFLNELAKETFRFFLTRQI